MLKVGQKDRGWIFWGGGDAMTEDGTYPGGPQVEV